MLVNHLRTHFSAIINTTPLVCHLLALFQSWNICLFVCFVLFLPTSFLSLLLISLVSNLLFVLKVFSPRISAVMSFWISLCLYMCRTRCWMPSLSFWSCFYCSQFVFVPFTCLCFWIVTTSMMQVVRARSSVFSIPCFYSISCMKFGI